MPPKALSSMDSRANEMKRLDGVEFAMRTGADMLLLQPAERERALKILSALHDTVARETQAATPR